MSPRNKRGAYFQKRSVETPFTTEEIEELPERHAARQNPNLTIKRRKIVRLEMPILTTVVNREAVFFEGEEPQVDLEKNI